MAYAVQFNIVALDPAVRCIINLDNTIIDLDGLKEEVFPGRFDFARKLFIALVKFLEEFRITKVMTLT